MLEPVRLAIITLLLFISSYSYAQKSEALIAKFCTSILDKSTMNEMLPFAFMIKIDVTNKGTIGKIQLSDSADSTLRKEIMKHKTKYNWSALSKYIKLEKLKNIALLIPCYGNDGNRQPELLNEQFLTFNDKVFFGNAIVLYSLSVQKGRSEN
jgi:hypothetical protein